MKKWLLLTLTVFLFVGIVHADYVDLSATEHIEDYRVSLTIEKSGKVDVREDIKYDFGGLARHGIFRDIPFIKTNTEGKKFKMEFAGWKIEDKKGGFYDFEISTVGDNIHLKIGDPDTTITGIHDYIISYTVSGALTYFSDHDEFFWNAVGTSWTVPIRQAAVSVTSPLGGEDVLYRFECFSGGAGSEEKDCMVNNLKNKVTIQSVRVLSPGEGLTIVAGFPIDLVARLEPTPVVGFFDTFLGKITLLGLIILGVFWYLIYPIWIVLKWYLYGRDPKITALTASFEAPKLSDGREMTPGEVGALIDERVDNRDVAATMVDLARRGYFSIEEREKEDFYLHKNIKVDERLLNFEKKLFDGLFEKGDTVRLKDSELYTTVTSVEKKIYETLVTDKLFESNPAKIRSFYSVIGSLAVISFNPQLAFVAFLFGRAMPKKTRNGALVQNQAQGLRNFLKSQERLIDFQSKTAGGSLDKQVLFGKLIPFAVAYGVEKEWAKRFEGINLVSPDWYQGHGGTFVAANFGNSLSSSVSSFRAAATPTSSSSGFSSGFSGGSSGGGGGGGGSW